MANLYFPSDTADAKRLSRLYQQGKLHRIRQGIYIDANSISELEPTLNSRWYEVAEFLFDRPVATHRTAAELKPVQGRIYLTAAVQKRHSVRVGPLQFDVFPGELVQGVEPFVPSMNRSNLPRQCLENLMPSRARTGVRKTLGKEWVERKLVQEVQTRGEKGLNALRDEAKALAPVLNLNKELEQLQKEREALLNKKQRRKKKSQREKVETNSLEKLDERIKGFEGLKKRWDISEITEKMSISSIPSSLRPKYTSSANSPVPKMAIRDSWCSSSGASSSRRVWRTVR